jgi:hypothetical protein
MEQESTRELIERLGALQGEIRRRRDELAAVGPAYATMTDHELEALRARSVDLTSAIVMRLTGRPGS